MAGIQGKSVASTYKDLLNVSGSTPNEGVTSSLKSIFDGDGTETAIQLSTTHLKIPSGKTLQIAGTLNCVDATLTGDLAVGDDLTVTDLISGASMVLTGGMTSDSATIGGGYSVGGSGATITSAGNIQTNGFIYTTNYIQTTNNLTVDGTSTLTGEVQIGGGFSNSGSGTTITTTGNINTNGNISCVELKTTSGSILSTSSTPPKVKLDDDTKVKLTVTKSGADKEILTVEKTGTATFKDEDGDTKFTVKDNGTVKYKSKTTTELNSITGTSGEIVFDSTVGAFKIWSA